MKTLLKKYFPKKNTNLPLQTIAQDISLNLGIVKDVYLNKKGKGHIILFEEYHTPIQAQVEIAQMFFRLYKNYNLKTIGLEGAFQESNFKPRFVYAMNHKERINLSTRLLAEGEINCADFMALVFDDIQIKGIDSQKEYKKTVFGTDYYEPSLMLFFEIIKHIQKENKEQRESTSILFENISKDIDLDKNLKVTKDINETFEGAISSNKWAKKAWWQFNNFINLKDNEEEELMNDILTEAKIRNINISSKTAERFKQYENNNKNCDKRSDIMSSNIVAICEKEPITPVACVVGSFHTQRMIKAFQENSISYVVICPNTCLFSKTDLVEMIKKNALSAIDLDRKGANLSQNTGYLGQFLDAFTKPSSVITEDWLAVKARVYNVVYRITKNILVDEKPISYDDLKLPEGFNVDIAGIKKINGALVFSIEVKTKDKTKLIWVKSTFSNNVKQSSEKAEKLEKSIRFLLREINDEVLGEEFQAINETQILDSNASQVSKGVFAIFSDEKENVEKASLLNIEK